MIRRATLVLAAASIFLASPAAPCEVPQGPTAQELVSRAELVVRVRAMRLVGPSPRAADKPAAMDVIRFAVLDILKGRMKSEFIDLRGQVDPRDDRNDQSVPYGFIRPGGRHGNCFALGYRLGADYLLLLRRAELPVYAELNDWTPYWSPLSPTNEQLFEGARDPWFVWVAAQLRRGA